MSAYRFDRKSNRRAAGFATLDVLPEMHRVRPGHTVRIRPLGRGQPRGLPMRVTGREGDTLWVEWDCHGRTWRGRFELWRLEAA